MLPDEGTFNWLDWFLKNNHNYCELSSRSIHDWAAASGIWPNSSYSQLSNDKSSVSYGIPSFDNGSVKQILTNSACVQERNIIVMDIKGNLLKEDRIAALKRHRAPHLRKVARVLFGDQTSDYRDTVLKTMLKAKQEK